MTAVENGLSSRTLGSSARTVLGRPWPPGVSGNPGGRPKGLAALVRQETAEGEELVRFMLRVMRNRRQSMRVRMEAVAWLADRGFGKPMQQVEMSGAEAGPLTVKIQYTDETDEAELAERYPTS